MALTEPPASIALRVTEAHKPSHHVKLIPDSIGKDMEKGCQSICPLLDVYVRKVKMLKKPKFELGKLMELHGEGGGTGKPSGDETGAQVERADGYEPPMQESV
ncbi:unnamed protein product [Natator depressus]